MSEEQFGTILTTIGKAKIANAALLGNSLVLKTLKIGDSNGQYYEPIESQTELKHEVYSCDIGSIKVDSKNPNWVKVETILSSNIGGFTIRELGICDADGDLIAISKYPETYKPIIENGAGKDICIRLIVEVSNAEQITLNLDPSVIIATKEDIDDLQEKIDSNTSQLNDKVNKTSIVNNCNVTEEGFVADARQLKILNDLIGSHNHISLILNNQLSAFKDKISDMLSGGFCVNNVSITTSENAVNSPIPALTTAWYTVLNFGAPNRCAQIAIQIYKGTYRNKVYFRTQHDTDVSDWINII